MFVRKTFGHAIVDSMAGMSRLRLLGLGVAIAVACSAVALTTASFARAAGEPTQYTATETIPVPPASNFAGSGGGDGWAVGLTSNRVYNVFHHSGSTTVNCHNQSDASLCWGGPRTITDGSGDNFSTSIAPGLFVDQNTGHLYVSVVRTSDDTAGVLCIDTTQPDNALDSAFFCGFTALTPAGEGSNGAASANGLSDPVQVGSDWYFMDEVPGVPVGAEDKMLCFDLSAQAACAGEPYPVDLGGATYGGMSYSFPIGAAGSRIFVQVVGQADKLACFDTNNPTVGTCGGSWPVTVSGGQGAPYPLLDGSGNVLGVCDPLSTIACFDLTGASVATPAGMSSAISGTFQYNGPAVLVGPRVYVPEASNTEVGCYDYAAGAGCPNFPKTFSNLGLLYTVNADPQRPACLWVNADNGSAQIQNFDAFSGGSCGQGPVRTLVSQFVNSGSQCAPKSFQSLQILSPANPQGTVSFEDGSGNPIQGDDPRPIGPNGTVDLSGLTLNQSSQFLIDLTNQDSAPSSLQLKLVWTAPYDTTCIDDDDVASNPAITATGNGISATEGASFSGAVASFKDPDGSAKASDYSASINWGDGSTSPGTITGSPSKFTVSGSHPYAEEGSFTATVTITDKDGSGNNATVHDKATVADAALKATGVKPSLSGTTASGTVATFTDADPKGAVSDYTASINWGDGTTTTGTVSKGTSGFKVSGSHNYGKSGTFTIKTTIKDAGGSTATATTTIAAQVQAARVSARLSSVPRACVTRAFTLRVHGTRIASVRFTLDGRRLASRTVHRGTEYSARIAAHPGSHSLTVRIKFRAGSAARSRTLHRTVDGCALPKFTG